MSSLSGVPLLFAGRTALFSRWRASRFNDAQVINLLRKLFCFVVEVGFGLRLQLLIDLLEEIIGLRLRKFFRFGEFRDDNLESIERRKSGNDNLGGGSAENGGDTEHVVVTREEARVESALEKFTNYL